MWAVLADLRGWETWSPDFKLKELDAVETGREFRWSQAGTPLRSRFAVVAPGRELSWTGVFLGIYKAVDRMVLTPEGTGTRVTVQESLAGPFLRLFYSEAKLRKGHEARLAALLACDALGVGP
ncbi:SRPBCC family protein [Actinomadura sp. CNU-125]|uniref:SRPBCC family protein n=1 Tax=Actinomadura sp. CNU-125 TaxID=1904961 RepID=UPI0021CD113B|nr:SRPBCC family protein [Actinomadura sp. CNU-125]